MDLERQIEKKTVDKNVDQITRDFKTLILIIF